MDCGRPVSCCSCPHVQDLRYPALRAMLEALAAHPDCVRLATHEQLPDVNSFLPFVDVLITDYSALYHDFLLLDRPILFVPYDYEEFEQQNGFLYDYCDCSADFCCW